jgi:hypothetical protein
MMTPSPNCRGFAVCLTRPDIRADVVVTHKQFYAAGIPAALVSLRHGLEQMDTLRTGRTPLKLNQRNRFDCPGCGNA